MSAMAIEMLAEPALARVGSPIQQPRAVAVRPKRRRAEPRHALDPRQLPLPFEAPPGPPSKASVQCDASSAGAAIPWIEETIRALLIVGVIVVGMML